ncbi:MAG: hypothetical protein PVF50_07200 [Gammaproteobacteria bacterium]
MSFFTIWSAYVLLIYFVGQKLSTLYVVPLTVVYTAFAIVTALGFQVAMLNQYSVIDAYLVAYPETALTEHDPLDVRLTILGVDIVGWVLSILFLVHRRNISAEPVDLRSS